jgi:hypothetical protein
MQKFQTCVATFYIEKRAEGYSKAIIRRLTDSDVTIPEEERNRLEPL